MSPNRRGDGFARDTGSDEWLHDDVLSSAPDETQVEKHRAALREQGWSEQDIMSVYPVTAVVEGALALQRQSPVVMVMKAGLRWGAGELPWQPVGPAPGRFKPSKDKHGVTAGERAAHVVTIRSEVAGGRRTLMRRNEETGRLEPVLGADGKPKTFRPVRVGSAESLASLHGEVILQRRSGEREMHTIATLPVTHAADSRMRAEPRPKPPLPVNRSRKSTSGNREPVGVSFGVNGRDEPDMPDRMTIRSTLRNLPSVNAKGEAVMVQRLLRHYNVTFSAVASRRRESVVMTPSAKGFKVEIRAGSMRADGLRQDELFSVTSNAAGHAVDYALGRALNKSWKKPYSSRVGFRRVVAQDIRALPPRVRNDPAFKQWMSDPASMHGTIFAEAFASLYGGAVSRPKGKKAMPAVQYGAAKITVDSPYRRNEFRKLFPKSSAAVLTALKKRRLVPPSLTL